MSESKVSSFSSFLRWVQKRVTSQILKNRSDLEKLEKKVAENQKKIFFLEKRTQKLRELRKLRKKS